MHRLKLFGGASIEGPAGPLAGAIAQRQRLAFLAVLSTAPTGLVSRDKLLALLWPDLDAGRARRALSNALYVIKKDLGEESVTAVGDDLRLNTDLVSVDVLEFEEAVEAGELDRAASLYTGPFLEGVHVKESPEFEKWVDRERDRLAARYSDVLEGSAEKAAEEGRPLDAADWWRKAAVHDPYSTRIALAFMKALAAAGDKAGALRYAQVHTTLLREEFGAEPDPALTSLEDRLRQEASESPEHPDPSQTSQGAPPLSSPAPVEAPPPVVPASPEAPPVPAAAPSPLPEPETATVARPGGPGGAGGVIEGVAHRLGRRSLVQWGVTYLAGAWFILQVIDVFSETWGISQDFQQGVFILLFVGFFLTLVLAWYHGEKGRQRVSGAELLIIAVLLVIAGGVLSLVRPSPDGGPSSGTPAQVPGQDDRVTIAVLPFQNFSPDPEDAYFADGIHEEILSKLSRISSLKVISRSSVMQFRESRPTVPEMAARLGADFFLEGSARIAGGLVRLTAQLIDAGGDDHVWAAEYDQPLVLDSLVAVQSRIADSIAGKLKTTLTPDERSQIALSPTDNLEAYELYLHGRFLWNQRTEPDMRRAIELFREAISLDSMYAYAYVGLADVYLTLQSWDFISFDEAIPEAEQALQRALTINPLLGEAHASLGAVLESRGDIEGAIASFQRSFELTPNNATGHHWFALLLVKIGYVEDALTHIRYAAELDPLSRMVDANIGHILHMSRDHAAAATHLAGVTQRVPDFAHGWLLLGEAYGALGRYEDALMAMGRAVELEAWPNSLLELAWVHARAGNTEEARAILERTFPRSDPLRRAQVHAALGETDRALELLDEGIRLHSATVQYLGVDPMWDPIRSEPAFQEVLARLGFRQAGG